MWPVLSEQLQHLVVLHPLGPGAGSCPRFGVRFDGVSSSIEQELHKMETAPAAGPAERGAFEQFVTNVGSRACVQQHSGEGQMLLLAPCNDRVQHGAAGLTLVGVSAVQQQAEADESAPDSTVAGERLP